MMSVDAPLLLFLGRLALLSCLACAFGLFVLRCGRKASLPFQHGLLLAILCLCLLSPVCLLGAAQWGWGTVPAPAPSSALPGEPRAAAQEVEPGRAAEAGAASVGWFLYLLSGVWVCGTAVLGLRLLGALGRLLRFRRSLQPTPDSGLKAAAAEALYSLGRRRAVPVCESPLVPAPLVLGWLRPLLVLPSGLARTLTPAQMQLVLRHEAAHLCRRDPIVVLLQALGTVLFWWNPLLHLVNARLGRLREQLCDDLAVGAALPGRRLAEALLHVAEWGAGARHEVLGAAGLLDDEPQELTERIERLLQPGPRAEARLGRCRLAVVLGLAMLGTASAVTASVATMTQRGEFASSARESGSYDPREQEGQSPMSGGWLMDLPAGFRHHITLTPVGGNRYRLEPKVLNSSGIYELQGNRLVIVAPNDRRLHGFEWESRGVGRFVLVGQPPVSKTGSNYLGAVLSR
jgi:beta-lactamase regulating signal transducer with metallopeptidase domain